jgi:hypothetical protein
MGKKKMVVSGPHEKYLPVPGYAVVAAVGKMHIHDGNHTC